MTWLPRLVGEVRGTARDAGGLLRGRDLAASAATATYFSGISIVPWLLLAVWSTSWVRGAGQAQERLLRLRVLVPPDMGGRPAYDLLVHAGTHVGLRGAVVLLFPASFYGEGLRRAALSVDPAPDRFTGWRARLFLLPMVVVLPALAWFFFGIGDRMVPLSPEGGGGGTGDLLVRVVVDFIAVWVVTSVLLTWAYCWVMPGRPRAWVAAVGGIATGSFLAGFLGGFQLFLSLPIDVGVPYAGLGVIGGVVAVGLWLYVLHAVVLVGWTVSRALDARVDRWTT